MKKIFGIIAAALLLMAQGARAQDATLIDGVYYVLGQRERLYVLITLFSLFQEPRQQACPGFHIVLNYTNNCTFLIGKVLKMRIIVYLCMVFHTLWGHFNYN